MLLLLGWLCCLDHLYLTETINQSIFSIYYQWYNKQYTGTNINTNQLIRQQKLPHGIT